jgi:peptidoglycan-N-acetylglucosamine deacetylase
MTSLALTFDDGPDSEWTPQLLDLLAACDARASFFPIASRAAANPDLIKRMLSEGHTVGLHCNEHVRHTARDIDWLRRDTGRALTMLARVGVRPQYWRTPWGDVATWTARVAREHDLWLVDWSVDTRDWRGDSAQEMFDQTFRGLEAGSVVLCHDAIGPGALRHDPRETIAYVRLVAEYARQHGLTLAALRCVQGSS